MPNPIKRTLKLRHDLPFVLEQILINKYGYDVSSKLYGVYGIFEKDMLKDDTLPWEDRNNILPFGLTDAQKTALFTRCDNVVGFFPDPYAVPLSVRQRLMNMCASLQTLPERQFVLEYADDNFPMVETGQ
jgi:hypothetical protein